MILLEPVGLDSRHVIR